jgi:hypothetical protein
MSNSDAARNYAIAATCQKALHKFQSFQHIWIVVSSAIDSVVFPRVVCQGRELLPKVASMIVRIIFHFLFRKYVFFGGPKNVSQSIS